LLFIAELLCSGYTGVKSEMSHRLSTLSSVTFTLDAVSVGGWLPIAVVWSTKTMTTARFSVVDTDAAAGTVTFTPAQLGDSTFQYGLIDEPGAASTITVKVHTIPLNDPPVAVDDGGYTTLEDQAIIIDPAGLLANDHDPNGDTITLAGIDRFARNGKVILNTDGTITFTPRPNYNGDAGFHYQISDGNGGIDFPHESLERP